MDKGTLNILSCVSNYYAIKNFKANNSFFDNDDFVIVDLSLFIGDISNLENGSIRKFDDYKVKINNEILNNAGNYKKIRIWSSRLNSGDYLSMLYCLFLFKDKEYDISVIFTDDLIYKEKNGKEYKPRSLSCCGTEDILKLLSLEAKLTLDDYIKYIDEWNEAINENAPLRIMHNGMLKGINYDFFDKYILDELKKGKQMTKINLCVQVMTNYANELGDIGDIIIMTRIDELIVAKKIKIIGRRPLEYFTVGEEIDENNITKNRHTIIEIN